MGCSESNAKPRSPHADIANALTAILLHSEAIRQHVARGTDAQPCVDHSTDHIVRNAWRIWAHFGDRSA